MAISRNLEQGLQAAQKRQLDEAKRLLKFALNTDPLTPQERVTALLWLAECDANPQFKIEQYEQALQLEPTNQEVLTRLNYWRGQLSQQSNTPSQGMQPFNPQQAGFQQGFTPTGGMPPVNPQQGNTPSQGMQPFSAQQAGFQQGFTPTGGMPPVNPQWQNPQQAGFQQGLTPTGGMPPVNQQQFTTDSMKAVQSQAFNPTPQTGQEAPLQLMQVQRSVGISAGPNGRGTGFFISRDGLIATTRYVVGGEERVKVELLTGQTIEGRVVRSFPEVDLAFIQVNVQLTHLLAITQSPVLADNAPLIAVTHTGDALRTTKRATKSALAPYWIPTVINHLKDAGGNPIFDAQNILVGMLTKNSGRSSGYIFGLHIHKIYQMLEQYLQEKQRNAGQNTAYCNACGIQSRAPSFGGFFCENCGNTLSYAVDMRRFPQPNLSGLYGENMQRPCPNCASQVGFYDGKCLRCGFSL